MGSICFALCWSSSSNPKPKLQAFVTIHLEISLSLFQDLGFQNKKETFLEFCCKENHPLKLDHQRGATDVPSFLQHLSFSSTCCCSCSSPNLTKFASSLSLSPSSSSSSSSSVGFFSYLKSFFHFLLFPVSSEDVLTCHPLFVFCLFSLSLFPMECFFILAKIKSFFKKNHCKEPFNIARGPTLKVAKKIRCTFFIFVLERHIVIHHQHVHQ